MARVCQAGVGPAIIHPRPTYNDVPMSRLKPLLVAAAIAAAVISFVRRRLTDDQPVDPGGWKPVDPS